MFYLYINIPVILMGFTVLWFHLDLNGRGLEIVISGLCFLIGLFSKT